MIINISTQQRIHLRNIPLHFADQNTHIMILRKDF